MTKTKGVAIILICVMPVFSFAMTREEAVQYALEHSESIQMIKDASDALKADADQTVSFTKPQVTLGAGYLELGDNRPANPFSPSPGSDLSAEGRITQLIFAGGRITKTRELRGNLHQQADMMETSGKRDISEQVQMAFDAVLYQAVGLGILKDRVIQRRAELADAQDLKEAGMVTPLDVRQAKLSLNFAKDQLKEGEASYQESLINFNLAIGRSGGGELLVPKGNLKDVPDMKEIMGQLEGRLSSGELLDVTSAETEIDAAQLNYDIAEGEHLPEILVMASGTSSGERGADMDESWNVGIQASWNIFDGGRVRSKIASAWATLKKTKENLSQTRKHLAGEIEKIGVNMRSLEQRIQLQQEAVELSRENYEDARGHYRAGMITLTQLGEFNLSYAEARFNLLRLFFLQREQVNRAEALSCKL